MHAFLSDPAKAGCAFRWRNFSITSPVWFLGSHQVRFRRGGQDDPLWMLPGLLRPYRNQLLRLMVVASALLVPNLLVAGLTASSSRISSRRNGSISGFHRVAVGLQLLDVADPDGGAVCGAETPGAAALQEAHR